MGARDNLQRLVDKKLQEAEALKVQVRGAEIYVQALQDAIKSLPREVSVPSGPNGHAPHPVARSGTIVALTLDVLREHGKPMHISELLPRIGRPVDKMNRVAVSGTLSAYVRNGEIFTRPAPNTFGLIDFAQAPLPALTEEDLPESFGGQQ